MDENETQQLAVRQEPGHELTVEDLIAQMQKIRTVMEKVMVRDDPAKGIAGHYGVIPGTNKPTLLKPGAEKLCLLFRLDPEYATERVVEDGHLTAITTCTLYKITTGQRWGSGQAICSSKESKYAYRKGERICPECGQSAIIKGKEQYGGGWLCWKKRNGCGAQWPDGATQIEGQNVDRVDNPDLADTWNTIIKMACKRALVAAVLNVTAASDIFTQDIEEIAENTVARVETAPAATAPRPAAPPMPAPAAPASKPMPKNAGEFAGLAKARGWSQMEAVKWARSMMGELTEKAVKDWTEDDYALLVRRFHEWTAQETSQAWSGMPPATAENTRDV